MAGSMTTAHKNAVLNHILKGSAYSQPTHLYVALTTSQSTDATMGTEVTGGSYARTQCDSWNAASGGATANTSDITFPTATASWGTVSGGAILDNSTGGNYLWWFDLSANKSVGDGDTFKFAAGDVDLSFAITP